MSQLIKFEFRKLFKSLSFIIISIIVGVMLIINAFILSKTIGLLNYGENIPEELYSFSLVSDFASKSSLFLLSGIFISLFVCDDYASMTIKNIYSKGYSRRQVFFAKYISSLSGVMIMTILSYILSIIISLVLFGTFGPIPKNYLVIFLVQLVTVTLYHSFYFFISNSIGKKGGAVSLCVLIPTSVSLLISLFDIYFDINISEYWISSISSIPFSEAVKLNELGMCTLVSILYILVLGGLSYLINRKKQF